MMHARNASLCFTCSGRSQIFFNKGFAKVDLGQCSKIMSDCHVSLSMTMDFIRQYKDLAEFNKNTKDFGIMISDWKFNPQRSQDFYKFIEENGVLKILKGYKPSSSPRAHTIALCDKFIKLRETTFIENVGILFTSNGPWTISSWSFSDQINQNMKTIEPKVAAYDKQLAKPSAANSNWSLGRRLLSMGGYIPSNMLTGDVAVGMIPPGAAPTNMDLDSMFP